MVMRSAQCKGECQGVSHQTFVFRKPHASEAAHSQLHLPALQAAKHDKVTTVAAERNVSRLIPWPALDSGRQPPHVSTDFTIFLDIEP